jgi:DNA-directed RNA polymerase subunit RPC12/RpoP
MNSLTETQIKNYVKNPKECPHCNSEHVRVGDMFFQNTECGVLTYCLECEREWSSIYELKTIEEP